jgi:hypothetical protein
MLSKIKQYWLAGVAIAVAILAFLFKREHDGKIEAQAKLETAESDKRDAVLEESQKNVVENLAKEQVKHDEEVAKDPSKEELLEALKKI